MGGGIGCFMKYIVLMAFVLNYICAILQIVLIVLGMVDWRFAILILLMNLGSGTYSLITLLNIRR